MSLVDLIVQRDAAFLISDSGGFNQHDFTVEELLRKEIVLPDLNVVIAATGIAGHIFPLMQRFLEERIDPADFSLDVFRDLVRFAYLAFHSDDAMVSTWYAIQYDPATKRASGAAFFTNPGGGKPGQERWTWYRKFLFLSPAVLPTEVFGPVGDAMHDHVRFDVAGNALTLVEAQRARRPESAGGNCIVAGEVRLTKVSAAGVEQAVLIDYGDRVGEMAGDVTARNIA